MEAVEKRDGLYGFEFRAPDERRKPDRETYDVKQLWQRSHEIINLAAQGHKQVDIAEILNISPQTVSNTLNSELGKRKLSEIRKGRDDEAIKTAEKIRVLTNKALATYHRIFDDETGEATLNDKKKVADTVVLELSGLRAPTRVHSVNTSLTLTPEEIAAFKERGKAAMIEAGIPEAELIEAPEEENDSLV